METWRLRRCGGDHVGTYLFGEITESTKITETWRARRGEDQVLLSTDDLGSLSDELGQIWMGSGHLWMSSGRLWMSSESDQARSDLVPT